MRPPIGPRWQRLVAAAAVLAAAPPTVSAGPLPAPYQADGLTQYRDDLDRGETGLGLGAPSVAVDPGSARGKRRPGSGRFQLMTVLGTAGTACGQLEGPGKDCSYVCGDEAESCR